MVSCYVFGCDTCYHGKKGHIFKIPQGASNHVRQMWTKNIPKRKDKEWNFQTSLLCDRHFEDKYLIKVNKVMFNGEVMSQTERKHWKLTNDAVPTIFANDKLPNYFQRVITPRKHPKDRKPLQVLSANATTVTEIKEKKENKSPYQIKAEVLRQSPLPSQWTYTESDNQIVISKVTQDKRETVPTFHSEISITISENTPPLYRIRGKKVNLNFADMCPLENILDVISKLEQCELCPGIINFNAIGTCNDGFRYGNQWISNFCEVISSTGPCNACLALKKTLLTLGNKVSKYQIAKKNKKIKTSSQQAYQKIQRLKKRILSLQDRLKILRINTKKLQENKLLQAIEKENGLPAEMKMSLIAAARIAKTKSAHGRRYAADWLLQCLLIRITSPKAYRFLRNNRILALPHPKYVGTLLQGIPCRFGFNEFVFKELGKQYESKLQRDRQFILQFDEIKVRESIEYDKISGRFVGFIDYGEFTEDYKKTVKVGAQIADHALVLMCRNLNSNLIQPLASFASRGAAPGHVLAKLIISCILKMEAVKCEVIGIVCDGATSNKSLWKLLGISGKANNVVSSFINPHDENRLVHVLGDMPHIIKCTRNHWQKYEVVKYKNAVANWGYFRAIYDFDKDQDLKVAPKITKDHVKTGPFHKMIVPFATQIFSKTVADGLRFYREGLKQKEFLGSETTEELARKLNEIFDILNARLPREGIQLGSGKLRVLEEFQQILCSSGNTFASDITLESFRVTVQSSINLISYLCGHLKFNYVLTVKFNQDCLERFFGLIRSFGGDDSHPTVTSFTHLFRLLTLYIPSKIELRGNIRNEEDMELGMSPYIMDLRLMKASKKEEGVAKRIADERAIKTYFDDEDNQVSDILLNKTSCVVYNLCGFIASKSLRFSSCMDCRNKLKCEANPLPVKLLTEIKSLGGLTHPSERLFALINDGVEPVLLQQLETCDISSERFLNDLICALPSFNLNGFGCCDNHSEEMAVKIVMYYITMRCFFYKRHFNREKIKSATERKKIMKQAKLT